MNLKIALWFYPSLLLGSGVWMVIWGSGMFQNCYDGLRQKFAPNANQAGVPFDDEEYQALPTIPVKLEEANINDDIELTDMGLYEPDLVATIPYKASTGLLVLGLFVISFMVIVIIRAIVPDLPSLFKFFSNIYIAGSIICGCALFVYANLA